MTGEKDAPAGMRVDVADRLAAESDPHSIAHVICDELRSRAATIIELSSANKALEARALAAEAALAAETQRCIAIVDAQVPDWVKERSGPYWDGYREAMEDAAEDMRKGVPARAAAIRAQGE